MSISKYGMNSLMQADAADPQFSFMGNPDPIPGEDYVKDMILEDDEIANLTLHSKSLRDICRIRMEHDKKNKQ